MDKTDFQHPKSETESGLSHLSSETAELFRKMTASGSRRPLRSLTPLYSEDDSEDESETSEEKSAKSAAKSSGVHNGTESSPDRIEAEGALSERMKNGLDEGGDKTPRKFSTDARQEIETRIDAGRPESDGPSSDIRRFSLSSVRRGPITRDPIQSDPIQREERRPLIPFPDLTVAVDSDANDSNAAESVSARPERTVETKRELRRESFDEAKRPSDADSRPSERRRFTLYDGDDDHGGRDERPILRRFPIDEDDFSPTPETSSPIRESQRETLLEVTGLSKGYVKGKTLIPVLQGVNVQVQDGDFLSVVGQSGSGKSTLLHLMGTLDIPDSGTVHFDGQRIDNLPSRQRDYLRNRYIGMIFQFYHLIPEMTMIENVLAPLMIRESLFGYFRRRHDYIKRAKELLDLVGLSHRIHHKPNELSGGEMQRTSIARALVTNPRVLLADEPTGNLDSKTTVEIIKLLRSLNVEKKLTIIMVTHDLEQARDADRVIRLVDGQVVESFRTCS